VNRLQVIERLLLGRCLEAELPTGGEKRRAFIEVRPVVDELLAEVQTSEPELEPLLVRKSPNEDAIKGYRVRFVSLNPGWESHANDWDLFVHEQAASVHSSLEALEQALSEQYKLSLESLRAPGNTESPL
jgi:hypothetical protein